MNATDFKATNFIVFTFYQAAIITVHSKWFVCPLLKCKLSFIFGSCTVWLIKTLVIYWGAFCFFWVRAVFVLNYVLLFVVSRNSMTKWEPMGLLTQIRTSSCWVMLKNFFSCPALAGNYYYSMCSVLLHFSCWPGISFQQNPLHQVQTLCETPVLL